VTSFAGRRTALQTFAIGFGVILAGGGVGAGESSATAPLVGAGARVLPDLMVGSPRRQDGVTSSPSP
jgi:hypothetical protein